MATEYRYFSLLHDADVVRLSIANEHGDEHFAIVEDGPGYRERRAIALDALADALDAAAPAGEVFPFQNLSPSRGASHALR